MLRDVRQVSFAERQLEAIDQRLFRSVSPTSAPGSPGPTWPALLNAALAAPVAAPPIHSLAGKLVIIVSDATRDEPREAFLDALLSHLRADSVSILVASGTHQPKPLELSERFRGVSVRAHDARDESKLVSVGTTARGTPVRLARELVEADHVISTGRLRPHYFAGFSAGVKGVFPGCAGHAEILQNHRLKAAPGARLGCLEDNPCRQDMEEAAGLLGPHLLVLNVVADVDGRPVAAAFGDPIAAHRLLAARANRLFRVCVPPRRVLVLADHPPLTSSLYQASKMLAVAEFGLLPGGTVVMLAECDAGTGPLERVNQGIYQLGLQPRLPAGAQVWLVSTLPPAQVGETYARPVSSLVDALNLLQVTPADPALVVWRAGECIPTRTQT